MTATTFRPKQMIADLKALSAICDFARKDDPDGIDVEHLFRTAGERKNPRIWSTEQAADLLSGIRKGLPILASVLYDPNALILFRNVPTTYGSLDDGELFVGRITMDPSEVFTLEVIEDNYESFEHTLPLILIRAAELAAVLPVGSLRVCKDRSCDAVFATTRSNKVFCSTTCRGRHNTTAFRKRRGLTKA